MSAESIPHIEDSATCWCNPVFLVPCPDCTGNRKPCARCSGARVVLGAFDDEGSLHIHFDDDEDA